MTDEHHYAGPQPEGDARTRLRARAQRYLRKRAEQLYLESVWAWAAADAGDYPTQRDADADALEELETLLHFTGEWGLVDPDTLPWEHRSPRGYTPDWEKDLLGE